MTKKEGKILPPTDEIDGRFLVVDYMFNGDFTYTTRDEIKAAVLLSEKLEYSWSVMNRGVYHTAVIIYLDGEPRYSVNWGPKSQTYTFHLISDVEGEITYGAENGLRNLTEYKSVLGQVNICELKNNDAIDELLDKLLTFDGESYNIVHCNCRDHVLTVMRRLKIGRADTIQLEREIESIRFRLERFLKSTE